MKLYKREIKPMINPGSFYGVKWDLMPVPGFDNWYPEEGEEELANSIEVSDPYAILVFEERFVEVKTGEWLYLGNDDVMSLVPQYYCSICGHIISGYYSPDVCENCGAIMKEDLSEWLIVDALNEGDPSSSVTENELYEGTFTKKNGVNYE